MTENPTTIPACLTDDEGGTLRVYPWASGRVSLVARDGDRRVEFGPVERHVLLDAIHEVAGETKRPVSYNHVRVTSEDVTPEQIAEALAKEPTPMYRHAHVGTTPTAEDFAKADFARHPDGRIAARMDDDDLPWCVQSPKVSWDWLSDADMAAEGGWSIVTPAPTTPREALALLVDLAYEPEGDTMPDQDGHMTVWGSGIVSVFPEGNPCGLLARGPDYRRLLLDPPAPTPAWHNARIVEATTGGSDRVEWARTEDGYWVALGGTARTVSSADLSDVTVVVPEEVEA